MPLLRRRFVCFYCSRRSAKTHPADTRQWECEKCNAVNHLDENGEITDPPATSSQTDSRFARSAPRSVSPEIGSSEEPLFCSRCLTNQHLFTQTLASYLPATTDPDYPAYEKNYPKYRKQLEERYPQVCPKCEPRVRERLLVTGYAAKTDHLRRMVEQTRNGKGRRLRAWGWQDNVVALAEICWWLSLIVQLAWHALSVVKGPPQADGLRSTEWDDTLSACVHQSLGSEPLEPTCTTRYSTVSGYALLICLLCAWWNPQLRRKLRGNVGRMVGLTEYYKLQVIFIVIRFVAWSLLVKSPAFSSVPQTSKAAHAFMLAFTVLSIIVSYRTVSWDPTPLVSFKSTDEALIPLQPTRQATEPSHPQHALAPQIHRNFGLSPTQQPPKPRFDITSLAPTPQRPPQPTPYNPPTPPPEDPSDADTMDWTPSHNVPSAKPYHSAASIAASAAALKPPNPFYGTLPPRPISQAHRLRNPIYQPPGPLERASAQQENFFRRQPNIQTSTPKQPASRALNGLSSMQLSLDDTFSPSSDAPTSEARFPNQVSSRKMNFAPPRFFPKGDYENDTGLENLFGRVFSLREEPAGDVDAEEEEEKSAPTPIEERRGIPGLEARPRQAAPRGRQRRSLLRSEVVLPLILLALVAQVWYFDVTRWGWLYGGRGDGMQGFEGEF